jgi:voltage-gated potassium channel
MQAPTQTTGFWRHLLFRFRVPLLLLAAAIGGGTAGYHLIERWGFLDALYMTVTTLTTVGFREVRPLTTQGRMFTIALVLFGVITLFTSIGIIANVALTGELGEPLRRRRMQRRIDDLRNHYVICAYGRVGRAAAEEFRQQGEGYVIVEQQEALERIVKEDGAPYIIADPTAEMVLLSAGIERAKGLVCAVDNDAINVYITLTARSLNPKLSIVARASNPESVDQLQRAGADRVVSPYVLSGKRMASLASQPSVVEFFDMVTVAPDLRLEEIVVRAGSPLDGMTAANLTASRSQTMILAVKKTGGELIASPGEDLQLGAGDLVVVLGPVRTLGDLAGKT